MALQLNLTTEAGVQMILLQKQECIQMELKLNVSSKGHEYKDLGDVLFYFAHDSNTNREHVVSQTIYDFLLQLQAKNNWEECREL